MNGKDKRPDLSIVIPVYYNAGTLENTMISLKGCVLDAQPGLKAEVIFVDDGSGDRSFDELLSIRKSYPDLARIIKLTRNFGQTNAILAGLDHAIGENVVIMSADGQDPAELINEMLKARFEEGFEVVVCAREGRDESVYRIITSRIFYALIRKICFPDMPLGGFDYLLLSRRAVGVMRRNREVQPFLQGQILWMGFKKKVIAYRRRKREVGTSKWTFGKKLTYLIDGVMNYSFLPIRLVSLAGLLIALLGFCYALIVLVAKLLMGNPVKGWAPLMIVVLVLGGFQMLTLGIFGEYVWRILAQVQNREPYIVDACYGFEDVENIRGQAPK